MRIGYKNSRNIVEADRRRYTRIKTSNFISYVCMDTDGKATGGGMGTSVNMSAEGLLLQTYLALETPFVLITYIDSEDQLREIKAKIIHSRPLEPQSFLVGIRFADTFERQYRILASFTRAYYGRRNQSYG
jgi:hypothetical protein